VEPEPNPCVQVDKEESMRMRICFGILGVVALVTTLTMGKPTNFPISTATLNQCNVDVAYNVGSDEFLVVWEDGRPNVANNLYDIRGQRVGPGGSLVGGDIGIFTAIGDQRYPAVAGKSGQCLVVCADYGNGDIWGQRVASNGTLVGARIQISPTTLYADRYPDVAYASDADKYLVVWTDNPDDDPDTGWNIYGKLVGSNGVLGAQIDISTTIPGQYYPKVAYSCVQNEFLVVWKENNDIYGQRVSSGGTLAGGNFAICTAVDNQSYPAVAYDSLGSQYLVVWDDHRNDAATGKDIYGQRVAGNGSLLGVNFGISTNPDTQWKPDVAYSNADNEFKVVWYDDRNDLTNDWDIYGQFVASSGALVGSNFAISTALLEQVEPAIAYGDTCDEFLTVWEDFRNASSTLLDVYGEVEPSPSMSHKMHFPQLPDMGHTGLDVKFTCEAGVLNGDILADDWRCSESGAVNDIHFWFSSRGDWFDPGQLPSQILSIYVSIHSNDPGPPSLPDTVLWSAYFSPDDTNVEIFLYGTSLPDSQGYYDPTLSGTYIANDHVNVYQCNITNIPDPFSQEEGEIYWLGLTVATVGDSLLGWKTADWSTYPDQYQGQAFMDDAVWGLCDNIPNVAWTPLVYPPQHPYESESMDLAFVITGDTTVTGVGDNQGGAPRTICRLEQNYPNPFNPTTTIRFNLSNQCHVKLRIYDVAGRLVQTLVDGVLVPAQHSVQWDGRDRGGRRVSSGVYFYSIEAGDFRATEKMVLLK
jgi:hypothetical protein